MHTENILKYLSDRGIKADCSMDRRNTLSSKLVRCVYEGTPLMAVGGDQEKNRQVNIIVDAVHWHLQEFKSSSTIRIVIGSGEHTQEILDAVAILVQSYKGKTEIEIEVDFVPKTLKVPDFSKINKKTWLYFFQQHGYKPPLT